MVTFGPLLAILALLGYGIGVISQKTVVLGLPSVHIITTAIAAGLLSPVLVVWGPRLNWISSAMIALALFFVVVSMLYNTLLAAKLLVGEEVFILASISALTLRFL